MKERIVIKDEQAIDEWNRTIAQFIDVDNKIYKAEFIKVPETFEELKELCETTDYIKTANIKNIPVYLNEFGTEYIIIKGLYFGINGKIFYEVIGQRYIIAENRTQQQMWNIIKSLIGEE